MFLADLTLPTAEENLACDEALLEACEASGNQVLRFWMPQQYFVVAGYANRVATEVNVGFCEAEGIPILRRCTGGGTVLQGPGCLNYSLILSFAPSGALSTITGTNAYVLDRNSAAIAHLLADRPERKGQTDLAVNDVKFSGNAQRRRKTHLLFHGTFLLDFDIGHIEKALLLPSRQPDYRRNRSHVEFVANLHVAADRLKEALIKAWSADKPLRDVPVTRTRELVLEKYGRRDWNFKF